MLEIEIPCANCARSHFWCHTVPALRLQSSYAQLKCTSVSFLFLNLTFSNIPSIFACTYGVRRSCCRKYQTYDVPQYTYCSEAKQKTTQTTMNTIVLAVFILKSNDKIKRKRNIKRFSHQFHENSARMRVSVCIIRMISCAVTPLADAAAVAAYAVCLHIENLSRNVIWVVWKKRAHKTEMLMSTVYLMNWISFSSHHSPSK